MRFLFLNFTRKLLVTALLLSCYLLAFTQQPTAGLLFFNEDEAYPSYTLFSNNQETYLIDNCGLIVRQWTSDYKPGRAVYLLEGGQLLRTAELDGSFQTSGRGGRFELFNWDGELEWFYEINTDHLQAHHDIEPLPNGNFLGLVWEKLSASEAQSLGRTAIGELWSEAVFEIEILENNKAEVVWEWHLSDHLVQNIDPELPNYSLVQDAPTKVDINYIEAESSPEPNWVHLNSIDYDAKLGHIVLSSRRFSEVWIIDHNTTTSEARGTAGDLRYRFGNPMAYYGTNEATGLSHQHDARWLRQTDDDFPQLMVFNNDETDEQSSVKIWTPIMDAQKKYPMEHWANSTFDYTYTSPDFYSGFMSGVQWLPNGHIFVCEGMSGRFFELDEAQNIVWEYINPVNTAGGPVAQGAEVRQNQTFRATKYGLNYPAFANRELLPGNPVEINPWESDCFVPVPYVPEPDLSVSVRPNIIEQTCTITTNQSVPVQMNCYDLLGRLVQKETILPGEQQLDFSTYSSGSYILQFISNAEEQVVKRVIVL